jgi:hypothetical protein
MLAVINVFLLPICSCILCVSRSQIPPWRDSAGEALPPGQTGGPSGLDVAHICAEAGWISPVKLPEQAHPVSPESQANGRAA